MSAPENAKTSDENNHCTRQPFDTAFWRTDTRLLNGGAHCLRNAPVRFRNIFIACRHLPQRVERVERVASSIVVPNPSWRQHKKQRIEIVAIAGCSDKLQMSTVPR